MLAVILLCDIITKEFDDLLLLFHKLENGSTDLVTNECDISLYKKCIKKSTGIYSCQILLYQQVF
jgi:hypothetical protein